MGNTSTSTQEFTSLLIDHQEIIRAFIITQIPGSPDVRDILQEVNIVLMEKQDSFELGTNFGTWACTVARYKVLEHKRKEARRNGLFAFNEELSQALAEEIQERETDALEDKRKALEHCMKKLSTSNRNLLQTRYQTHSEALARLSAETGRTRESLRVTLCRIRSTLRRCVGGYLFEEGGLS